MAHSDYEVVKEFQAGGNSDSTGAASAVAVAKSRMHGRANARKRGVMKFLKSVPTRLYNYFLKNFPELVQSLCVHHIELADICT